MRLNYAAIERYRETLGSHATRPGWDFGAFIIPGPCGETLKVIASPGDANPEIPWEHVSVSTRRRTPNWKEMCFVKDLFFAPEEAVMQLHPPKSQYVNNNEFGLHLWRPIKADIPMPPMVAV